MDFEWSCSSLYLFPSDPIALIGSVRFLFGNRDLALVINVSAKVGLDGASTFTQESSFPPEHACKVSIVECHWPWCQGRDQSSSPSPPPLDFLLLVRPTFPVLKQEVAERWMNYSWETRTRKDGMLTICLPTATCLCLMRTRAW